MNRRQVMMLPGLAFAPVRGSAQQAAAVGAGDTGHDTPDKFPLKDCRPKSICRVPVTDIKKAK